MKRQKLMKLLLVICRLQNCPVFLLFNHCNCSFFFLSKVTWPGAAVPGGARATVTRGEGLSLQWQTFQNKTLKMCLGVWHDVLSRCLMMCHNVQWAFGFGFVHPIGVIYDHLSRDLSSRIQVTVAWTAFLIPSTPYPRQGRPTRYTSLSLRKGLPVATPKFLAAPVSKRATLAAGLFACPEAYTSKG